MVGATGAVGTTMIQVLEERGLPVGELRPMASRADGRTVDLRGRTHRRSWRPRPRRSRASTSRSSRPAPSVSAVLAPEAAARGALVIDNSAQWRMIEGIPLVVTEVNPDDAALHEGIIANPNCSTMQLVPLLMALRDAVGLERVIVDTYQAVGGTGAEAIDELQAQILAHAAGRPEGATVYPHPIAFNALPEIDVFLDDGYFKEEWKVIHESRKILHLPDLRISCTAVRVPVFVGHSEAVHVETRRPIRPDAARELFAARCRASSSSTNRAAHRYPLATEAAGRDEIFVGRVRADVSMPDGRGLAFWCVSDNLRKGAATNAVQIAELVLDRGWLAPASMRAGRVA